MRVIQLTACACALSTACGGAIAGETPDAGTADAGAAVDGSSVLDAAIPPADAPPDVPPVLDAGLCPPPVGAPCESIQSCVLQNLHAIDESMGNAPDGAWVFDRQMYMLDFFQTIAVDSGACDTFSSCTYDPFEPAPPDASAGEYSNSLNEFVGPDGFDYVWTDVVSENQWLVVRKDRNPGLYEEVAESNACIEGTYDGG